MESDAIAIFGICDKNTEQMTVEESKVLPKVYGRRAMAFGTAFKIPKIIFVVIIILFLSELTKIVNSTFTWQSFVSILLPVIIISNHSENQFDAV